MKSFDEIFVDRTKFGKKITTDEYLESGTNIIIDQGQSQIAGYTDLVDGIFSDTPAIVFGDHTRVIKYVESPFFLGADGVKVLKSKIPDANYKYLYYALKNAKIPNTGYNRHYKWLKEIKIRYPGLQTQAHVVQILDLIHHVIVERQRQVNKLDELIKARFVEMFGKMNRTTTIARYIAELRGGKSLAGNQESKNKVLKTGAATFGWFDAEQYKYLPADYEPLPEHKVATGDVIISRMNTPDLVGACSYVFKAPENMYYPDRLWKVITKKETNSLFLWQLLWDNEIRRQIKEKSGGTSGTMHNISKPKLLEINCIDAPFELQNQYADFVNQINKSKFRNFEYSKIV